MADSSMSIGAYGSPYENGILGGGPGSLPSLVTNQPPGMQSNGNGMASPSDAVSAGGTIRRAAPEPNKRALYVGGLDQRVTEDVLQQIFATAGAVKSVKIIPDKNVSQVVLIHSTHSRPSDAQRREYFYPKHDLSRGHPQPGFIIKFRLSP
jgi:hypothetical protein